MIEFSFENVLAYCESKKFTYHCALCMLNKGCWCDKALNGYKTKIYHCEDAVLVDPKIKEFLSDEFICN